MLLLPPPPTNRRCFHRFQWANDFQRDWNAEPSATQWSYLFIFFSGFIWCCCVANVCALHLFGIYIDEEFVCFSILFASWDIPKFISGDIEWSFCLAKMIAESHRSWKRVISLAIFSSFFWYTGRCWCRFLQSLARSWWIIFFSYFNLCWSLSFDALIHYILCFFIHSVD